MGEAAKARLAAEIYCHDENELNRRLSQNMLIPRIIPTSSP